MELPAIRRTAKWCWGNFAVVVKVDKKAIDYEQTTKIVSNMGSADEKIVWDCAVSLEIIKVFIVMAQLIFILGNGEISVSKLLLPTTITKLPTI